ncbi:MAG: hypothetical protein ACM65K_11195 [Microcoleus sp.]
MLFATFIFDNAFYFIVKKGFAILIKSWKITFGAWDAIALLEIKGDRDCGIIKFSSQSQNFSNKIRNNRVTEVRLRAIALGASQFGKYIRRGEA